jgi:hypothetical protein
MPLVLPLLTPPMRLSTSGNMEKKRLKLKYRMAFELIAGLYRAEQKLRTRYRG